MKGRAGDRRLLGSASTKHVMPLLLDVATRAVADCGDVRLDEAKLSTGYICRPCFRGLEKIQKLQQQVESMRGDLYTNAKKAVPYLPTLPTHQSVVSQAGVTQSDASESEEERCSTSQLGRKRSSTDESPGSRKKRRLQLKKIEQAPVVSESTTSPPVAVSLWIYGYIIPPDHVFYKLYSGNGVLSEEITVVLHDTHSKANLQATH